MTRITDFKDASMYINRELSWLEFDNRVLSEAQNVDNPLYERLRFLSISANNLDEFFMVRVGSLSEQAETGVTTPDASGRSPRAQLNDISAYVHQFVKAQYKTYYSLCDELLPLNKKIIKPTDLDKKEMQILSEYFEREIYPVLTPMAVDISRPFPLVLNKSLNIALILKGEDDNIFATVQVPSVLPRLIKLDKKVNDYLLLEDVILHFMPRLFTAHQVLCASAYRITRNADMELREEEAEDLLVEMEKTIEKRKRGDAIRLEISKNPDKRILKYLKEELDIQNPEIYELDGPLNLTFVNALITDEKQFVYPPYTPRKVISDEISMFDAISQGEILLHHPYDSFDPVVRFVREAAADKDVLAIKQTLYRVSGNSPIIHALEAAAMAGKQVTVLVEVKARFDEQNNINWAKRLEKAGCHVIYGLVGLKTHCKITLVLRKEAHGLHRYIHLGTGNYNDVTARIYSDFGYFTDDEHVATDACALFNMLSGYSLLPKLHSLIPAPTHLRTAIKEKIKRATETAKRGGRAYIFAKCNSVSDPEIIRLLYKASCAGVKIDLVVRGICCLRPGITGVSENITVKSIVGRYLEHERIYHFVNNDDEEVFLSSADLLPRNLDRRVELMFEVKGKIAQMIKQTMKIYLEDNKKSHYMQADGSYVRIKNKEPECHAQQHFMNTTTSVVKTREEKH